MWTDDSVRGDAVNQIHDKTVTGRTDRARRIHRLFHRLPFANTLRDAQAAVCSVAYRTLPPHGTAPGHPLGAPRSEIGDPAGMEIVAAAPAAPGLLTFVRVPFTPDRYLAETHFSDPQVARHPA